MITKTPETPEADLFTAGSTQIVQRGVNLISCQLPLHLNVREVDLSKAFAASSAMSDFLPSNLNASIQYCSLAFVPISSVVRSVGTDLLQEDVVAIRLARISPAFPKDRTSTIVHGSVSNAA